MNYTKLMRLLAETRQTLRAQSCDGTLPVGYQLKLQSQADGVAMVERLVTREADHLDKRPGVVKRLALDALLQILEDRNPPSRACLEAWYKRFVMRGEGINEANMARRKQRRSQRQTHGAA